MNNPTITASGVIPALSCVKVSTTANKVAVCTTSTDTVFGVTFGADTANNGEVVFQTSDTQLDIVTLRAGGTILVGDQLVPDAAGTVVTAASGQFVAITAATSGTTLSAYKKKAGTSSGGTPGNPTGSVQFNNAGAFAGDAGLTYNSTTDVLTIGGDAIINGLQVGKGNLSLSGNVRMGTTNFPLLTTGNNNTALGSDTTTSLSTGANNVMVGFRAGFDMVTATENVVIGFQAGYNCYYGNGNVLVGSGAGQAVTSGGINTFVGKEVAVSSAAVTGSDNVGIGAQSLRYLTSGYNNVAVGGQALYNNTTVANNIAIGNVALYNKTSNGPCTAVGYQALKDCISGEYCTALGNQALVSNMYGNRNVALGEYALDGCKGNNNIGTGINSGYRQWTGADNVFIGDLAGAGETSGDYLPFNCNYNVAIGSQSMRKPGGTTNAPAVTVTAATPGVVTLASHGFAANTPVAFVVEAIGGAFPGGILQNKTYYVRNPLTNTFEVSATSGGASIATSSTGTLVKLLYAATAGDGNSCFGYQSGLGLTTGANNVFVGRASGDATTTGSTNICVGYNIDLDSATGSSQINIGGVYFHNRLITTPLTLAQLNALPGLTEGMRGFCTDATTTTFASTITGGSSNNVPCYYDGAWKIG